MFEKIPVLTILFQYQILILRVSFSPKNVRTEVIQKVRRFFLGEKKNM